MTTRRTKLELERLDDRLAPAALTLGTADLAASGVTWTIDDQGGTNTGDPTGLADNSPGLRVVDATIDATARTDAFDGGGVVFVGGQPVIAADVDVNGQTLTAGPVALAGLDVTVQYTALSGSPTLRTAITLSNSGATDLTVSVAWVTNLGSDGTSVTAATSSGDTAFTAADRWVLTDDADPTGGTLAVNHVLAGPGAPVALPVSVSQVAFDNAGTEGVRVDYSVTVPAGQSRSLLFFHQVRESRADLLAAAPAFNANPAPGSDYLSGLSAADLAGVVNWDFSNPTTADAGGPYTVAEGGAVTLAGGGATGIGRSIAAFAWDLDGNGTFETAGPTPTFSAAGLNGPGSRVVTLRVTDNLGETATAQAVVQVANVPPVLSDIAVSPAGEGTDSILTGKVVDAGTGDTFTVTVDWGDGATDTFATGGPAFSKAHRYPVTKPGGYAVQVTATDLELAAATPATATATVANAPPVISGLSAASAPEGSPVTLTGTITDPGSGSSFLLTVNWGDGATESSAVATAGPFSFTHTYPLARIGGYDVRVTARDQDGAQTDATTTAAVAGAPPTLSGLAAAPNADGSVTLTGSVADPGTSDQLTVAVVWGDGTTESFPLAVGATAFSRSHAFAVNGRYRIGVTATDTGGLTSIGGLTITLPVPASSSGTPTVPTTYALGSGPGGPATVTVYDAATRRVIRTLTPFGPDFFGGVSVALADVTGDGILDVVCGAGVGGGPRVSVFDGSTGELLRSFFAYDPGFLGGVYVAAGDLDGDGIADLITGAGAGGGPHVRVFDGRTGAELLGFFAADASQRGGVTVAVVGSADGGPVRIVAGAGVGYRPAVDLFDARTGSLVIGFAPYEDDFLGGVNVAIGDIDGDGVADLICGAKAGGAPRVVVVSGRGLLANAVEPIANFFSGDPDARSGVRIGRADADGDGHADILAASGRRLAVYAWPNLTDATAPVSDLPVAPAAIG